MERDNTKLNYNLTKTKEGVPYYLDRVTNFTHLNVCPKCGKKIDCCTLGTQPTYVCKECFPDGVQIGSVKIYP